MSFKCPTCGCLFYDQFIARRKGGKSQRTELHFCMGCTTVFLEPDLFSAAPELKSAAPVKLPDMQGDIGTLQREIATRYWSARATRERGGVPARKEDVVRLRSSLGE